MTRVRWRDAEAQAAQSVSPVELFFDVVFVLTITQLTSMLEGDLTLATAGQVVLIFGVLWWMYGGYAWLTNHVPPRRAAQKLLLFAGMAGFLVSAVALPRAFDDTGVLFALGYLIVVSVHLLLFTQSDVGTAIVQLAPFNLGSAALLLVAGASQGPPRYGFWIAALGLMVAAPRFRGSRARRATVERFHLVAAHFVERHGLLVIVALGESVIAIGMGVDAEHLSAATAGAVVLALFLPGELFWAYFSDVGSAEANLAAAEPAERSRLALRAYAWAHVLILLGIVTAAAGIHGAVGHPEAPAPLPFALALSGGTALFLTGHGLFRRVLRIGPSRSRLAAAMGVLAVIPAARASAAAHVAAVVLVVGLMLVADARMQARA